MSKQVLNIKKTTDETFWVTSGTDERSGYAVNIKEGTCECPQNFHRGLYCKHQEVVDENLIIDEKILLEKCSNHESNKSLNCAFQQVMLDRGYICLPEYVWKKREAYDAMADDKKQRIIIEKINKNYHTECSEFHLFEPDEEKQLYLTNGLSKYNEGDDLFIMCKKDECFPEHEYVDIAEKVHICGLIKESGIIGKVNWD